MVSDKICKMTVMGVKSKSESFFSISYGVLELWRKNLRRGGGGGGAESAWIGLNFCVVFCFDRNNNIKVIFAVQCGKKL